MDPLVDQRRYLAAAHAAARGEPDAHACQLAALDRERALAAAAATGPAYRAASGDLFELVRAAWLDRLIAHARVAAALDDPWTVRAAALEVAATLAARGHADWTATLATGSAAAAPWHDRATISRTAPAALVAAVVRASWDRRAATQVEAAASVRAALAAWAEIEPALGERADAATLAALFARPRQAQRTPWAAPGVAALVALIAGFDRGRDVRSTVAATASTAGATGSGADGVDDAPGADGAIGAPGVLGVLGAGEVVSLFAAGPRVAGRSSIDGVDAGAGLAAIEVEVARWRAGLAQAGGGPLVGGEPDVAAVVAPYAGLTALPGDEPVVVALRTAAQRLVAHARGAATAQEVLAVWTEAGLLTDFAAAPVRAQAAATLARTERWPDPLLAAGARALLDDLSEVRTQTEIDLVSMHHGACAAIEADWNQALASVLFAPINAVCIAGWDPEGGGSVASAWQVAHGMAGLGGDLLAVPRVDDLLAVLANHAALPPDLGAWLGEIGHDVVSEARAWFGVRGHRVAQAADVAALIRAAWGQPPSHAPSSLRLWGERFDLDGFGAVVPGRPLVPGLSRRSGRG